MPLDDRARHLRRALGAVAGAGARRLLRRREDDDVRLGRALLAELDEMKGLAMKVGQLLSYLDAGLPEATTRALAALQEGVSALPPEAVDRVIEEALGGPASAHFDRFEAVPVAAASIGQVHRAWRDGRAWAVKVQYPGVAETFAADTARLRRLASLAGLATAVDGRAIVDDLAAHLAEECDYLREARATEAFRRAWADDPGVRIPEVDPARSAATVLTTTWLDGRGLADLEGAPDGVRQRAARHLARFAWTNLFRHGVIHADPHPGNHRVDPGGHWIGVLDFGCVQRLDPAIADAEREVLRALWRDDRRRLHAALEATGVVGDARFDPAAHEALLRWTWAPYLRGHGRFTRDWLAQGRRHTGPGNPNLRHMAVPPHLTWMLRLTHGLHAVLTRLGAEGDYRALLEPLVEGPAVPLRIPPP